RHGRRTAGGDLGRCRVGHFQIEICRFQTQLAAVGLHQDVGENWNGIASLDHAMDVARLQKFCTLYGNFHENPAPAPSKRPLKPGATASRRSRNAKPGSKGGESARFSQGRVWGAVAYPQASTTFTQQKGPAR